MNESDESDEWATDELPDFDTSKTATATTCTQQDNGVVEENNDLDNGWETKIETKPLSPPPTVTTTKTNVVSNDANDGETMIIINMTKLSNGKIHSRYDPNGVNDMDSVKVLRKQIELHYLEYYQNMEYICDRIVIPCGSSVWKDSLSTLRKEYVGDYFCPIFCSLIAHNNS